MWDFYLDPANFVLAPGAVSRPVFEELALIRNVLDDVSRRDKVHERLCSMAWRTVRVRRCRLPDSLHNRMVLGPSNPHVVRYLKMLARL